MTGTGLLRSGPPTVRLAIWRGAEATGAGKVAQPPSTYADGHSATGSCDTGTDREDDMVFWEYMTEEERIAWIAAAEILHRIRLASKVGAQTQ